MFKGITLILVLSSFCVVSRAQVTAVVYDIETHMPVAGATIFVNPHGQATTDRYGRFFLNGKCNSITLTHVAYEKRVMYRSEVKDTIFLLPKLNVVDSVVIIGNRPKIGFDVKGVSRNAAMSAPKNGGIIGFDFFKIFEKKKKSKKEREKFNKLMRNYSSK